MARLKIEGPCRLEGEVRVHGAKNSTLPLLAACLLCGGECVLHNCPQLSDVGITIQILRHLGCKVQREGSTVTVDSSQIHNFDIPDEWMREMRSSIVFLGAILARTGKAELSEAGGTDPRGSWPFAVFGTPWVAREKYWVFVPERGRDGKCHAGGCAGQRDYRDYECRL